MTDRSPRSPGSTDWMHSSVTQRLYRGGMILAGLVILSVALVIAVVPETEQLVPIDAALQRLGSDYLVVAAVGLAALGVSAAVMAARHLRGVDEVNPPVVEAVQSAVHPGTGFDRTTAAGIRGREGTAPESDRRDRLRTAAVEATMRADGCARSTAEKRVATGSWSGDPVATEHLSAQPQADSPPETSNVDDFKRDDEAPVARTIEAIAHVTATPESKRGAQE